MRITSGKIFLFFYSSVIVVGILIFVCVFSFLYKNFYRTITSSEKILILNREVVGENIDMDKFEEIIKKIEDKQKPRYLNVPIKF